MSFETDSYLRTEVLQIRDRFLAAAKPANEHSQLYEIPAAARMTLNERYRKTDLLIDILEGSLASFWQGTPDNVFALLVDVQQIKSLVLKRDFLNVIQQESFLRLCEVNRLIARLNEQHPLLTSADMKRMRRKNMVRFQREEVFDGHRYHPSYKYNAKDILEHILPESIQIDVLG